MFCRNSANTVAMWRIFVHDNSCEPLAVRSPLAAKFSLELISLNTQTSSNPWPNGYLSGIIKVTFSTAKNPWFQVSPTSTRTSFCSSCFKWEPIGSIPAPWNAMLRATSTVLRYHTYPLAGGSPSALWIQTVWLTNGAFQHLLLCSGSTKPIIKGQWLLLTNKVMTSKRRNKTNPSLLDRNT